MAKPGPKGPTKWKPEMCDDLVAFFSVEPNYEKEVFKVNKKGDEYSVFETKPNQIPFFGVWERKHKISRMAVSDWAKPENEAKYPGFRDAYLQAKEMQKEFLISNALLGLYNPTSFIFTAKNITDMRDVSQYEHGGVGGTPLPLLVIDRGK